MERSIVKVARHSLATHQIENDEKLIGLWLHGRSEHTQRAYGANARAFLASVGKPLASVSLEDLQHCADGLAKGGRAPASQILMLSAVKSLIAFAHRLGYLQFDVGRVLKLPKKKDTLAERIITEGQVLCMIALEENVRNHAMLMLLYAAGIRVSELCGLCWKDAQPRGDDAGQVVVYGKGGKTRTVLLPGSVWAELVALRGDAGDDAPIFASRERGADGKPSALDQSQVNRIVHAAARRAKIKKLVSPHWMRHAHASHAIDHGAPVHLVAATLGHASIATTGRYLHARPTDSSSKYLPL